MARVGIVAAALVLVAFGAVGARADERGRITVEAQATIVPDVVRLGDVAMLEGDARSFADVDLGPAPDPGTSRRLTGAAILRRLVEAGVDTGHVRYAIPASVRVERAFQEVGVDEIRTAVENVAPAALAEGETVRSLDVPGSVRIPLGAYEARVTVPASTGRGGRRRFDVQLVQHDATVATVTVRADIDTYGPVVTVREAVPRGTVLRIEDLNVEEREVTSTRGHVLRDPQHAVGKETKVALVPGAPVTSDALANPMLVQRGDLVTLVVETPALRVSMPGEALEAGAKGAGVRVKNRESQQEIAGTVVDRGVVLVQY